MLGHHSSRVISSCEVEEVADQQLDGFRVQPAHNVRTTRSMELWLVAYPTDNPKHLLLLPALRLAGAELVVGNEARHGFPVAQLHVMDDFTREGEESADMLITRARAKAMSSLPDSLPILRPTPMGVIVRRREFNTIAGVDKLQMEWFVTS